MVFLDANPVIYYVEQPPTFGPKAKSRINALIVAGEQLAVTDLVRMECLVGPLKSGDAKRLKDFRDFFTSPPVQVVPIPAALCDRAAGIRAAHGFKPLDSLHFAAAVEHGCARFMTNDTRLSSFPDISIEILS